VEICAPFAEEDEGGLDGTEGGLDGTEGGGDGFVDFGEMVLDFVLDENTLKPARVVGADVTVIGVGWCGSWSLGGG
jgi:hypothetical protein